MKLHSAIFLLLLLAISLFASLNSAEKKSVLIVHSYSQEYAWTKKQHEAFITTLAEKGMPFEFYVEYLDTKRLEFSDELKEHTVEHIKDYLKYVHVDAVYVTDDNALEFLYENYALLFSNKKIPVFFSGINNLKMETLLPKDIFRGVYELKDIQPNIELIKQFSPQTRNIYIVGDNSNTYKSIKEEIQEKEKDFANMHFHYLADAQLTYIMELLPKDGRNFVILTTIGNFKDNDGNTLLPKESISKLTQNSSLILLSMEDSYMFKGVVGGYVTSAQKQGSESAKLLLQYLKTGSLETIQSIKKNSNLYMFDAQELLNARVLLSEYIRREALIIHKQQDFIETNKMVILEGLALVFLLIIFLLTAIYALQRKRHLLEKNELPLIAQLQIELADEKQLISYILKDQDLAYWSINLGTNTLDISDELIKKLDIEMSIYKNDKDLISYFIHSDDKKLFFENVLEVGLSQSALAFQHRMINTHNELLNVEQTLYYIKNNQKGSPKLLGVIKFEA